MPFTFLNLKLRKRISIALTSRMQQQKNILKIKKNKKNPQIKIRTKTN
jgi:hypothetical protein